MSIVPEVDCENSNSTPPPTPDRVHDQRQLLSDLPSKERLRVMDHQAQELQRRLMGAPASWGLNTSGASFGDRTHSPARPSPTEKKHWFYRPLNTDTQDDAPKHGQVTLLKNQVSSLKEIIALMEGELNRACFSKQQTHASLLNRWRKKVFECLQTTKRYELLIEENVKAFNSDAAKLQAENGQLKTSLKMVETKLAAVSAEFNLNARASLEADRACKELRTKVQSLSEENTSLQQALSELSKASSDQAEKTKAEHQKSSSQLEAKVAELEQQLQETKYQHLQTSQAQSSELQQQIASQLTKLAATQESNEALTREKNLLSKLLEDAQSEAKTERANATSLRQEMRDANTYLQAVQEEKSQLSRKHSEAQKELFTFREQKTEELTLKQNVFESKMDRLQQECSSLRQANSLLEAQTKQLETASQEQIARLNSERDDQLKEKSKQIRQLKTQRDTLYEELRGVSQRAATDRFGQQSEKTRTEAKRRPFHFEPTDYQRLQTSDKLPRTIHASSQINPFSETLSPKQNQAAYSRSSFSDVDEEQQKLDELEALALEALNDI